MTEVGLDIFTPDLVVVRGPAAAGRAWVQAWVAEAPRLRARVCLAELVAMAYSGAARGERAARIASAARQGAVEAMLHRGVSVGVDGDDLDDATVDRFETVAWACAARLLVVDLRRPHESP